MRALGNALLGKDETYLSSVDGCLDLGIWENAYLLTSVELHETVEPMTLDDFCTTSF